MMVYCVFSLETPQRGDSNEYTQYTISQYKKNLPLWNFFQGTQERVRTGRGKRAINVRAIEVLLYLKKKKKKKKRLTLLSGQVSKIVGGMSKGLNFSGPDWSLSKNRSDQSLQCFLSIFVPIFRKMTASEGEWVHFQGKQLYHVLFFVSPQKCQLLKGKEPR